MNKSVAGHLLTHRFASFAVEFTLNLGDNDLLPPRKWLSNLPEGDPLFRAVSYLTGAVADGDAEIASNSVIVANITLAHEPRTVRRALGLPRPVPFTLCIENLGTLDEDSMHFGYSWRYQGSRLPSKHHNILAPVRTGLLLETGPQRMCLEEPMLSLLEGVDRFNNDPPKSRDERFRAWADLRCLLGDDPSQLDVRGYLMEMRVSTATAFCLEIGDTLDQFDPLLVGRSPERDGKLPSEEEHFEPVLAPLHQQRFAEQFRLYEDVRSIYTGGDNNYVIIDPALKKALEVVQEYQRHPDLEIRREFAFRPQLYLKQRLDDELSEQEIEGLFFEFDEYSDRVERIGLFEPGTLPGRPEPSGQNGFQKVALNLKNCSRFQLAEPR